MITVTVHGKTYCNLQEINQKLSQISGGIAWINSTLQSKQRRGMFEAAGGNVECLLDEREALEDLQEIYLDAHAEMVVVEMVREERMN